MIHWNVFRRCGNENWRIKQFWAVENDNNDEKLFFLHFSDFFLKFFFTPLNFHKSKISRAEMEVCEFTLEELARLEKKNFCQNAI